MISLEARYISYHYPGCDGQQASYQWDEGEELEDGGIRQKGDQDRQCQESSHENQFQNEPGESEVDGVGRSSIN